MDKRKKLQSILLAIETQSEHPLAEAVVRFLDKENIEKIAVEKVESITGKGIMAVYEERLYAVGSPSMMKENNVAIDDVLQKHINSLQQQAKTVILFRKTRQPKPLLP